MTNKNGIINAVRSANELTECEICEIVSVLESDLYEDEFANIYIMTPTISPRESKDVYIEHDTNGDVISKVEVRTKIEEMMNSDSFRLIKETTTLVQLDDADDKLRMDSFCAYYISRVLPDVPYGIA